jgi:hypothetical protein
LSGLVGQHDFISFAQTMCGGVQRMDGNRCRANPRGDLFDIGKAIV